MATSLSDALAGNPPTNEPVEAPEVEAPAAVEEPTPVEAEAPEQPEQPAKEPEQPHMVPVNVVRELREEIRNLKAAQQEPEPVPDVLDNPEGFVQHVQNSSEQRLLNERLNMSEEMTRMSLGDSAVDQAFEAFQNHLGTPLHNQIMQSRNPYREMVQWHQREQAMSEIGDDPAAYKERLRAELKAELEAEQTAQKVVAQPPPSLASTTNSGNRSGPAWTPTSLTDALNGRR